MPVRVPVQLRDQEEEESSSSVLCPHETPQIHIPSRAKQAGIARSLLYSGSIFRGHQKSKGNCYDVEVLLQHVDLENSYLCGYLRIKGLTEEFPSMTTFFDAEIIGFPASTSSKKKLKNTILSSNQEETALTLDKTQETQEPKFNFLTRKWDADEDVDRSHWSKFPSFSRFLASSFNSNSKPFDYSLLEKSKSIFMRWKEVFLVPDHKIKDIAGASFAGFYYICFSRTQATIEGFYYHRQSEWFQSLSLSHVHQRSTQVFQFR